jgi:hypothetical protein
MACTVFTLAPIIYALGNPVLKLPLHTIPPSNWVQVSIFTLLSRLLPKAFSRKPLDALADELYSDLPGHFSATSFLQSFNRTSPCMCPLNLEQGRGTNKEYW